MADEELREPGYEEPGLPGEPEEESSRARRMWDSLGLPARLGVIAVGVLALALVFALSFGRTEPEKMEVLFHRLDPIEAREVAAKLDEMMVPYELEDGGATILVQPDQRDRLRISLSPDLYARGIGFALFEEGGLVASDFERKVQWQIALEEELRRTITSIDAVDQARVHLVITEEGLFIRERQDPSASVFLRLSPLSVLTDSQVRGILSLVAGSVEGLNPENVTIIDSNGNILYDAFAAFDEMTVSTLVEGNLKLKRQFEAELEKRLRSILEQVYGPGKAVAMVTADLDFDDRERTTLEFDDEPVPRATHRIEERSENLGAPGEEVGEPNIPGQAAEAGGGGESTYERIEEIINYEIGEIREYVNEAPGQVMRLSTAVIIDGEEADPFLEEQVTELVNSAIGMIEERGDMVSVQLLPFDTSWMPGPEPEPEPIPEAAPFPLLWVIIAAAALLLVLLAIFLILRARSRREAEEDYDLEDLTLEEQMETTEIEEAEVEPGEEETRAQMIRKLAEEEPESVAGLLKTWLTEE